MRIVFMGSAPLACPTLNRLLEQTDDEVVAVITQPDRPKGRKLKLSSCAVKILAESRNIQVLTPDNINSEEVVETLRRLRPHLIVVTAYGQILKGEILALPPEGCINIHASLLPEYRGAAPIQWAIVKGERVTGVTAMFMAKGMDDGDIIRQEEVTIEPEDTAGSLHDKLAEAGAVLLGQTLNAIRDGNVERKPQIDAEATFAPKLTKEDGRIDWTRTAEEIYNRVRGFNPWPMCWCVVATSRKLRVLKARVEEGAGNAGEVIDISGDGPLIGAGNKAVRLLEVQPEGKKRMTGAGYACGHSLETGDTIN